MKLLLEDDAHAVLGLIPLAQTLLFYPTIACFSCYYVPIGATVGTPCWGCVDMPVVAVFTAQNSIDKFENEITLEDDAHAVLA